tara:strand:- start:266 stop:577 length:312 start_codon:yes stop_codon:yes gene_type:complete
MPKNLQHVNYYSFIKKGDLVRYTVESFTMTAQTGFMVEEEKFLGIVVSDLIEAHGYGMLSGMSSLGHPMGDNYEPAHFRIYCIKSSEIIYISCSKIELVSDAP